VEVEVVGEEGGEDDEDQLYGQGDGEAGEAASEPGNLWVLDFLKIRN